MLTKRRGLPSRSVSRFRVSQNAEDVSKLIGLEDWADSTRYTKTKLINPQLFAPDFNPSSGHVAMLSLFLCQTWLVKVASQQQENPAYPNDLLQPDPQLRWIQLRPLTPFHTHFRFRLSPQIPQLWLWTLPRTWLFAKLIPSDTEDFTLQVFCIAKHEVKQLSI